MKGREKINYTPSCLSVGFFSALRQTVIVLKENFMEEQQGYITVMAISILAILTVLGIAVSHISNTDIWISRNEAISDRDFYIAEGGLRREVQELGNGHYKATQFSTRHVVAGQDPSETSVSRLHLVMDEPYAFKVEYVGRFLPVKGFSAKSFSRYDYTIDVVKSTARLHGRYYTVGPRISSTRSD